MTAAATRRIHWRFTLVIVGLLAILLMVGTFMSRGCTADKGTRSQIGVMLRSDRANVLAGGLVLEV